MKKSLLLVFVSLPLLLSVSSSAAPKKKAKVLNLAKPDQHPFVDTRGGREGRVNSDQKVNEARVYDFYQRQADYYMAKGTVPAIIPAFPGLDAGQHGHWGKHNQNQHKDGRWNETDQGPVVAHVFKNKSLTVLKGICVKLDHGMNVCFDSKDLNYRAVWEGDFLSYDPFRWGSSRNANQAGKDIYSVVDEKAWGDAEVAYLGNYRMGRSIVFNYQVGDAIIFDRPTAKKSSTGVDFQRSLHFVKGGKSFKLLLGPSEIKTVLRMQDCAPRIVDEKGKAYLVVEDVPDGAFIWMARGKGQPSTPFADRVGNFVKPGAPLWKEELTVPGTLGTARDGQAYVVDTLTVPYDNPYKTVMQLSSMAFLPNGDALVSVLSGEIWLVRGINDDLKSVRWRRFATGFNQPIGIHIDEDGIFVLDRGQITRLHDRNNDGEADFYENYANDFGGYNRSHTHTFGLVRTSDKAFHFVQREHILRTGSDRKTAQEAWGVRNCMAVGGDSSDRFYVAPQEGSWTPASAIIEVKPNEFYGLYGKSKERPPINAAMCYVPRGMDNSTGGIVEVTSDKWGPFKNQLIGLSYGSGTHYLILRDHTTARSQGAAVPLEGDFLAGVMRGAFHPEDGQLYTVGLDGWGDYSVRDGCFHRVRYTGGAVRKPIGFQVFANGIRVDFPVALDPTTCRKVKNYFAQQWNYEYASRYGSPEFSIRNPESLGHDPVDVRSVLLENDNTSLFIEMPGLAPAMQLHIRMHLQGADGTPFKTDIFPTLHALGPHRAEGLAPPMKKKKLLTIRVREQKAAELIVDTSSGSLFEGAREMEITVSGSLQYDQKVLNAKAGEQLALKLVNKDVIPHNLVLVQAGAKKEIGEASFAMLNDPKAGEKHYVPASTKVIAHTYVVNPGGSHVLHFKAPTKPGSYPFLCTFPGHWQIMQGVLEVE